MKTLLSFIFLLLASMQLRAQVLYPILIEAHQRVNRYDYSNKDDLKESQDIKYKLTKLNKRNLEIISDALLTANFTYSNVNDTLLLIFSYRNDIVSVAPSYIFAKSSTSVKVLHIDSYRDLKYVEVFPTEKYAMDYYPIMYAGDVDSFRELFIDKGVSIGGYVALRIVIKNGEVVFPLLLWEYTSIPNMIW